MTADLVSIATPAIRAEINPFGAELSRLQDRDGQDLLWSGDAAWWGGRAPLLFPVICRLPEDRFLHDGRSFELVKHGFARRRAFEVVDQGPERAAFRLTADPSTRAAYPFDFVLDAVFEIAEAALQVTIRLTNVGTEPMPAAFGFHPAFRWPLPGAGARSDHAIEFEADELGPLRRLDASGMLRPEPMASPIEGRRLALADALFQDDALILQDVRSRQVRLVGEGGRSLEVSWSGLPHLAVWTKPGAPFVCIEPWSSLPAQAQPPTELGRVSDLTMLQPGGITDYRLSVRPS